MGVLSPSTMKLTLKWVSLGVALLLLLHWGATSVDAQQQRQSCDPQRLSDCRDYMERRREQPSESCCNELERMSPQCRCQAIQQVLDQSSFMGSEDALNQRRGRRQGQRGRESEQEMAERAAYLPDTCDVQQPPRRCDIRRPSRYFMTGGSF